MKLVLFGFATSIAADPAGLSALPPSLLQDLLMDERLRVCPFWLITETLPVMTGGGTFPGLTLRCGL